MNSLDPLGAYILSTEPGRFPRDRVADQVDQDPANLAGSFFANGRKVRYFAESDTIRVILESGSEQRLILSGEAAQNG